MFYKMKDYIIFIFHFFVSREEWGWICNIISANIIQYDLVADWLYSFVIVWYMQYSTPWLLRDCLYFQVKFDIFSHACADYEVTG